MQKLKVGDKIKYKKAFLSYRPVQDWSATRNINEYTVLAVDEEGKGYIYPLDNKLHIRGSTYEDYTWQVEADTVELIEEEVVFEEPEEDEFDENCTADCKPGEHNCNKNI